MEHWKSEGKERGVDMYIKVMFPLPRHDVWAFVSITDNYEEISCGLFDSRSSQVTVQSTCNSLIPIKHDILRLEPMINNIVSYRTGIDGAQSIFETIKRTITLLSSSSQTKPLKEVPPERSGSEIAKRLEMEHILEKRTFELVDTKKENEKLKTMIKFLGGKPHNTVIELEKQNQKIEELKLELDISLQKLEQLKLEKHNEKLKVDRSLQREKCLIKENRELEEKIVLSQSLNQRLLERIEKFIPTPEQSMELCCKRAKEGAIKQREARERLAKMYDERPIEIINMTAM